MKFIVEIKSYLIEESSEHGAKKTPVSEHDLFRAITQSLDAKGYDTYELSIKYQHDKHPGNYLQ